NLSSLGDFSGLTYDGELAARATGRTRVRFSFARAINPSNRPDTTYSVDDTVLAEGDYAITPRLQFGLGASQKSSDYKGVALVSGVDLEHERLRSEYASLKLALRR